MNSTVNNYVKLCAINVCGIRSKLKLGILDVYVNQFDVICLCETKLDLLDERVEGFTPFYKEKTKFKHGGIHGICILVKDCLVKHCSKTTDSVSDCVLWLHLAIPGSNCKFTLGSVYIPHEGSIHFEQSMFDDICTDIAQLKAQSDAPILLLGDFNARTGKMDDFILYDDRAAALCGVDTNDHELSDNCTSYDFCEKRYNKDVHVNNNGKQLIDLCISLNLKILNGRFGDDKGIGKYTCTSVRGSSTIDYAVASPSLSSFVTNLYMDNFDKCLSDVHSPVCLNLSFNALHNMTHNDIIEAVGLNENVPNVKTIVKWDQSLKNAFSNEFDDELLKNVENALDCVTIVNQTVIDDICSCMNDTFFTAANSIGIVKNYTNKPHGNVTRCNKKNKPWFDNDCRKMRANYFKVKRKSNQTHGLANNFKSVCNEYKQYIRKKSRTYFKSLHVNLRNLQTTDPKEFWSLLNRNSSINSNKGNITLDTFYEHFKKLSQAEDPGTEEVPTAAHTIDPRSINHNINEEINKPFTVDEIRKVASKFKCNKSCGNDKIINEFIKHCPERMIVIITRLFNMVLETGTVPHSWCVGLIKPLYKGKGDINNPDNYRGITILSCMGKLFTAVINKRLTYYVEAIGLLGDEQAGFRQGFSTIDHIFVLHSILDIYLHKRKRLYCAFVDYRKAFDLVDRSSLWMKLISSGINGKVLTVIYNLYLNAKSCVKTSSGAISDYFLCNVGVRQGENLSPLLFAIYLNDFEACLRKYYNGLQELSGDINKFLSDEDVEVFVKLYVLLYADDTIIMAETVADLQSALNATAIYCKQWHLTVNTDKTKVVIFSRGKIRNIPSFLFCDSPLEVVFDYTYLGTIFNYNNNFKKAIAKQVSQASRATYSLSVKSKRLCLPIDIQLKLFHHLIVPILLYGCEVWGYENLIQIEVFFRKFLKEQLHVKKIHNKLYGVR